MTAFAIVSTFTAATLTDRNQQRWPVLVYMSVAVIISSICILVWSSPTGLKFFAYCECRRISRRSLSQMADNTCADLAGASYAGQATTFAWANQICADDDQERGIVLASMKYVPPLSL